MKSQELLDTLEVVEPALADHGMIPSLQHFWFLGDRVMAFNDQIAISAPCETEFKGAAPGNVMLNLLKVSRWKNMEPTAKDGTLTMRYSGKKAGSVLTLGLLPPTKDNFVFEMPTPPSATTPSAEFKPFLEAVENCMRSVSSDTSVPDQLGVTVIPNGKKLDLYSTNDATLSHASTEAMTDVKERAILSGKFCKELVRLAKLPGVKKIGLKITPEYVIMSFDEIVLFGRMIASSHPINYQDIIKAHLPAKSANKFITPPTRLSQMLERAVIITDATIDTTKTVITVAGKELKLFSQSDRGRVEDKVDIDEHDPVKIKLNPKLVKDGYDDLKEVEMLITPECLIMRKGTLEYFVAANE